jgi:ferredoxin, 2Fe-2S
MPRVSYVLIDGSIRTVDASEGQSVMQTAVHNAVPGIEAECGGFLNCATCHVYVEAEWLSKLPAMTEHEDEMLEGTVAERQPNSRLSCQLKMSDELDGIVVAMPDRQI